jgi:tetraprenyl-beta-curcumene synthase
MEAIQLRRLLAGMPSHASTDPAPLDRPQLRALAAATGRELSWGLLAVSCEMRGWRSLARRIPDPAIRADALRSLRHKRGHADGAALFSVLPDRRNRGLLRLLVAYEAILDFLDDLSERHTSERNGRELHLALLDAVDLARPLSNYYRHHPAGDDGGYLKALVELCRRECQALPSYERVRPLLVQEARRTQVLALNHLPDPQRRDAALRQWAAREFPDGHELSWFELSGTSSASLAILALLALATDPHVSEAEVAATHDAYWPWISGTAVMLDSYADQADDAASGDHSYVAHYPSSEHAVTRLCEFVDRSVRGALGLPNGHRHAVVAGCMVAMYLSKDSVRTPEMAASTRRLVAAGGSLTRVLLPVLRLWRIAYAQRSS